MESFPDRARQIRISPYRNALLFALGVFLLTFTISSFYAKSTQDQNRTDFETKVGQQTGTLRAYMSTSMEGYSRLILSSAAAFSIKPDVTHEEWQQFYTYAQKENNFPKIVGLGYASAVPVEQASEFEQSQRDAGREAFTVQTDQQKGMMSVITYLAPESEENIRAIGFDMFAEQSRRLAMETARDRGDVVMTAPVQLVQDEHEATAKGVLIYYPVYTGGMTPDTVEERRATLRGYVYAVLRPADIVSEFLSAHQSEFENSSIVLTDVTDPASPDGLYLSAEKSSGVTASDLLEVDTRAWQFEVSGRDTASRLSSSIVLFVLGGVVSLLLSALTYWALYGRLRRITTEYEGEVKRTKDELLALASHQLRTPASGVKQYLGILTSGILGTLTHEQQSIAEKAYEANERQLQIINELLYVSKADAGQLVIEPKRFDLTTLTQKCIDNFGEQAAQKDIKITYLTKRPYFVTADDRYISMAVENLISNAIKYSYPSSKVRIGLRSRGDMVHLYVKDSGVGVDVSDHERIFDKFDRVDNPLSHSEGGSGLGLFLARQLVRAHGGEITVDSHLEKGSTFTMTLPKKLTINQTIVHLNRIKKVEEES